MLMLFPLVAITLRNNTREFVAFLKRSFRGGDKENIFVDNVLRSDDRATTLAMGGKRSNFSKENMIYTASAILPAVAGYYSLHRCICWTHGYVCYTKYTSSQSSKDSPRGAYRR